MFSQDWLEKMKELQEDNIAKNAEIARLKSVTALQLKEITDLKRANAIRERESIQMKDDMDRKEENLNTSREVWEQLSLEEVEHTERQFSWWKDGKQIWGSFRKITLPAPLTPISYNDREPEQKQLIIEWNGNAWSARWYEKEYGRRNCTHWLPQDTLPKPNEKSLSDECEEMAQSLEKSGELFSARVAAPNLLRKAAKELRK